MTNSISSNLVTNAAGTTIGKTSKALGKAAERLYKGEKITKPFNYAFDLSSEVDAKKSRRSN
ncbi:hypothetical protein I862_07105 [endosymbiont of Acanthamoeba sp. UWC8]|uniref:hypothetical protein n=1 Tax=endosymbiont of Acanthamoeba sp. UWC8 TaxID=86106 RepID=UPI0004D1E4D8|nr:hypothetical protein [endosymbiont of Acanthamoeba sp. UWC8]AIF81975.1 hypothetical protein I862_07105 [endosymbiont of Acanthamoeba sp. UWC8]